MALFSKKKGEEPNDAQPAEALEANAQEAASKMDAREVAGVNERAEGSQAESAGEAKAARSAKAASESASPEKKRGFRGKRRSKRLSKKEMLRVQELEDALAEDADIDAEAIVSMYLPKRRMHRIGAALLRIGTLQKVLLCLALFMAVLFGISFMQENMGNFTINLNRLELFRRGVAIADNAQFEGATARLSAEAVADGTNIAVTDLPDNLDQVDGSHNGKSYVAYTFYIRNAGKEDLNYDAKLKIVSASKGAEKAARVRVYRNGEAITYAAPAVNGGNEAGCENFESDDTVCHISDEDFKLGYVDKYTVVIWLDGDDPECVDSIIGGEVEFAMDFDADDAEETSLIAKFVEDILDTLTGNDPISASGNDAPDYYKNNQVTWDTRRNQENPPA